MKRLHGKKALVTAAGQGIGRSIAERLADEGADVLATDLKTDLFKGENAFRYTQLDVTSQEQIREIAGGETFDILLNCAGFVANGSILECSESDWEFSHKLNVTSAFQMIKAVLPGMLDQGSGSIVNISSVASSIIAAPNRFVYGVTKAAIIGMTKSVAVDYVGKGIRCNAICPGTIQSPSLDDRINAFDDPVKAREQFIARQPMGRLGKPEEIAAMAAYLAADESAFTTGAIFTIDGGWTTA
ncbi:SDR family oxidoreductase [Aquisalinus flavus]|uniref:Oxidoreductase n=1 Tax=Aquisalinus flavus TaxID=1526572 RepID=A0A8J2V6C7_9PROT|nr:SDR family oxidoreductase [Aquisalinus flavus]MBD0426002.1 SDR family oxidoreductase [Aquisalinus flavus]UNE48406.1 SDR family oxidoreductase [Aquisalinus flavus]GGD11507.1 oxidoreductase [Aquisalinus flavus]